MCILHLAVIATRAVTRLVYYFWVVKSIEQCKEDLSRAEKRIVELKDEAATARQKKIEALEDKAAAEIFCSNLKIELTETEMLVAVAVK